MNETKAAVLTLEPDVMLPEIPTLTLTPEGESIVEEKNVAGETASQIAMKMLSEEEIKVVNDFSSKINVYDSNMVMQYGSAAQKKVASFSDSALENVRTKDLGEVGDMMTDLVSELKGFEIEPDQKKGFFGLFRKAADSIDELKTKYTKAETNVDRIVEMLEGHQITLLKDIAMLDKMYELNLTYFKELTMYILAGKKKLEEVRANELAELRTKAEKTGLAEDAQAANDLANMCNRFEKKIYDLELTRNISIQMSPQIRLIQNNDMVMTEKIQSSIVNTIPLWKSQMVLALGLAHSRQAMEAQRAVTDMTNELLKKNAEALKIGSIETAREAERGIVDMETLQQTNQSLISTLDEVLKIQQEGTIKRRNAEIELGKIETELKNKLLELKS